MTIREQIEQKEQELEELRKQERREREEARKENEEKRKTDFDNITKLIKEYNEKYGESLTLAIKRDSKAGKDLWFNTFPWLI